MHEFEFMHVRAVFKRVSKVIRKLLWFCFTALCDWLKKTYATYSTNQIQNQSRLGHLCLSALGVGYIYLLRVLIG